MVENERHIFTLSYYEEFVSRLCEAYSFTTLQEGKKVTDGDRPLVIMRHDIDMDLEAALRISLIEKKHGIRTTYFFMVGCPLYNVFSPSVAAQVHEILAGKHHMGLHFDCSIYKDISHSNLNYYILKESQLLEQFFDHPVEAVSFHRPGHFELSGVELDKWPNSYERVFLEKFEYFSDSRGNWARGNPLESEAFFRRKNLHILVHPVWWTEAPTTPYERLVSLVQHIGQRNEQYISENCQVWNKGR